MHSATSRAPSCWPGTGAVTSLPRSLPHLSPVILPRQEIVSQIPDYVRPRPVIIHCWVLFLFAIASGMLLCSNLSNRVLASIAIFFLLQVCVNRVDAEVMLILIAPFILFTWSR